MSKDQENLKLVDTMQLQLSDKFTIAGVRLQGFSFKLNAVEKDFIADDFKLGVSAIAYKKDKSYDVITRIISGLVDDEGSFLFEIDGAVSVRIDVEKEFDDKLLNNVVAIGYSYFRPLAAQATVMAKLPPLDLPVLDLSGTKVEVVKVGDKGRKKDAEHNGSGV